MDKPDRERTVTLSREEIAIIQLDRSIELLLEKSDFISAITLAGAAEEIIGKIVTQKGIRQKHVTAELTEYLAQISGLSEKEVRDNHLNRARNSFKHFGNGEAIVIAPLHEAVQVISRAMCGMFDVCGVLTSRGRQFAEWTKTYKSWVED